MPESSKMPKVSFVLILIVCLVAIALVASQKFGQSRDAGDSLLAPVANLELQAGKTTPSTSSSATEPSPANDNSSNDDATYLSLTTVKTSEPIETGPLSVTDQQPDSTGSDSATDRAPAPDEGYEPSSPGTETSQEDSEKKDPMRALSRQFARRRAVKEGAKEAQRITVSVPKIIHEPSVSLSEEHKKMCLVGVGDTMPDLQWTRGSETIALREALKDSYTVVVFWSVSNPYSVEQFTHLASDVVDPFSNAKLKAIAVHVGEVQEVYTDLCDTYGKDITCVVDADKSSFAKIATRKLPRTYLLDADGKILWFDIEYSRSTRHELLNAVQYYLQGQKITPPDGASSDEVDEQAD